MASLMIGGQVYDLVLSARDLARAEQAILKDGGRPILAAFLGPHAGFLAVSELESIVWAAWRRTPVSDEQIRARLAQFYAEGGTVFELHAQVVEAILDSGLVGRRVAPPTNGGPLADPPGAGTSG
jgi:hypothetical protein